MLLKNISIMLMTLILTACKDLPVRRDSSVPLESVPSLDLNQYSGKWYNIANYPNGFQDGCSNTSATYTIQEDHIEVLNVCLKPDGESIAKGKAWAVDATNAKLKVRFFPLAPAGDYWVVALDEKYQWAVVGEPSGKYLWILARTPALDQDTLDMILEQTQALGYPIEPLEYTVHN